MLNTSIDMLPHTSGLTKKRMHAAGINTYKDLLTYAPTRYEDYSRIIPIKNIRTYLDQKVTIQGEVLNVLPVRTRSRLSLQKIQISDGSGKITISFFNQPYVLTQIKKGLFYAFAGTVKQLGTLITLQPETFEHISSPHGQGIQTGRVLPVYSEAKGLSSRLLREKIATILPLATLLPDTLPKSTITQNNLMALSTALQTIHAPHSLEQLPPAKHRLAFEELFLLHLSTSLIKKEWDTQMVSAPIHTSALIERKIQTLIDSLPFQLTADQKTSFQSIHDDMILAKPMNRFLQGDVGSGKTVVAALAAYFAYLSGKKTLYMAPTEVLALQHAETFHRFLADKKVSITIHTGSQKNLSALPHSDIIIGTHALLNLKEGLDSVGLVIIDEQHRFGVKQRALLKAKGVAPHLLTMTATPIPRTVALTAFGELSMSVLSTLPSGRLPIKTYAVTAAKRQDAYTWMEKELTTKKAQLFIICPLVDESTTETLQTVKAATAEYVLIQKQFPSHRVGLLHGKMKPQEKQAVLNDFRHHTTDILVSTSVVEVGIDIPNASIMVIEGAERFGLSQLHQLRGRVGRGDVQSYCLLFTSLPFIHERLRMFASTNDGMKLAEYDLKERGPGNIYGIEQHGFMEMKFASFSDLKFIEQVQRAAEQFLASERLEEYPTLAASLSTFHTKEIAKD